MLKRLSVDLSPAEHRRLQMYAIRHGVKMGPLMRECAKQLLAGAITLKPEETAERRGANA